MIKNYLVSCGCVHWFYIGVDERFHEKAPCCEEHRDRRY